MANWTYTEINQGSLKVQNDEGLEITVLADFSGNVTNEAGDFIEFEDLRTFIEAADLLKQVLNDHYGGYK